jgi:hypothetical protein
MSVAHKRSQHLRDESSASRIVCTQSCPPNQCSALHGTASQSHAPSIQPGLWVDGLRSLAASGGARAPRC